MPVNSQVNPQIKAFSNCKPNQDVSQEPFFTRKKRVGNGRKVTFISNHSSDVATEDNLAQRFRAGYRRANSGHPSSYQMHYCQGHPGQTNGPVLDAVEVLEGARKSPSQDGNLPTAIEKVSLCTHLPECPISKAKHGGETKPGYSSQRPPFVEPLALPLSDDKETKMTTNIKRDSAHGGLVRYPVAKLEESSMPPAHEGNGTGGNGTGGRKKKVGVTRKMRRSPSPLRRLFQSDHQLCQDLFETEYSVHYKDWIGEKWGARRQGGRRTERSETSLPTYGYPPVLTDSTDPRLLKHSPPPTLPLHPPKSRWLTQYQLHFVEPKQYKYDKTAFRSAGPGNPASETPAQIPLGTDSNGADEVTKPCSWFDQLLELRRKAQHYKWKSEHSSFLPHHIVALDPSQQNLLKGIEEPSDLSSHVSTSSARHQSPSVSSSLTSSPTPLPHTSSNKDLGMEERFFVNTSQRPTGTQSRSNWEAPLLIKDVESDSELVDVGDSSSQTSAVKNNKNCTFGKICTMSKEPLPATLDLLQPSVDVKCSCATRTGAKLPSRPPFQGSEEIQGQIRTHELPKSTSSNVRHHLDRTTPSDNNLLISRGSLSNRIDVAREFPSARVMGTGGRDLPRHNSGTRSPNHTHVPGKNSTHSTSAKNDTAAALMLKSAAATTSSNSHTNTIAGTSMTATIAAPSTKVGNSSREFVAGRSRRGVGGLAMASYGSDSCKTCDSSVKPTVFSSTGMSQKSSNLFRSKTTKGRDYIAPATVAARPSAYHGRSCDKENSIYQHLQKSQLENCRQFEKIGENFASHTSQQPLVKHSRGCTNPSLNAHTSSLKSQPGRTYSPDYKSTVYQSTLENDEEPLSMSPLSTSSCSVASGILEKARHRRDHFWTSQKQPYE